MKRLSITAEETGEFTRMVRRYHFFGAMNMVLLEKILAGILVFEYDKGVKVFTQGEEGDAFYVVQRGQCAVTVRKGTFSFPRRVAVLGPGECFGEMALLRKAPRNATVHCLVTSRLFVLSARHFQTVLDQNPDFAGHIKELASSRQFELDHRFS